MGWADRTAALVAIVFTAACDDTEPLHGLEPADYQAMTEDVSAQRSNLEAMAEGWRYRIEEARVALATGEQTRAALALDDAHALARVGEHATGGYLQRAFRHAVEKTDDAREAMQNGQRTKLLAILEDALATVELPDEEPTAPEDPEAASG